MNDDNQYGALAREFAILSVLAFGGINTVLPEVHRQAVDVHGWMDDRVFADLFAIAQAAPGPNFMIIALIGWHVAGLLGAVVTMGAFLAPTVTLAYVVSGAWQRFREARWRKAMQAGMIPVTVGLVAASAYVLFTSTVDRPLLSIATFGTAAVALFTKIHPLIPLGVAGVLGYFGWF